jgi:hypothetical protein
MTFNINLNCEDFSTVISFDVMLARLGNPADFSLDRKDIRVRSISDRTKIGALVSRRAKKLGLNSTGQGAPTLYYSGDSKHCNYAILVPHISQYRDDASACIFFTEGYKDEAETSWQALLGEYEAVENWKTLSEFFYAGNEVRTKEHEVDGSRMPLILPELYPDVDIDKLIEAYFKSNDSILMLYGDPGTGKTTLIKKIIYGYANDEVAYLKDQCLVSKSELWSMLGAYKLIILDDLDCKLTENRQTADPNASSFMSNILSFSDGITNPFERPKIVISTNQNITEIDSALIRPGRCFDFIHLTQLTAEKALDIWVGLFKLSEESFQSSFGNLKLVSQSALINERDRMSSGSILRDYVKTGDKSYSIDKKLADLGISVSESTDKRKQKSTGFV